MNKTFKSIAAMLMSVVMLACGLSLPANSDNDTIEMTERPNGISYAKDVELVKGFVGTVGKNNYKTICGFTDRHSEGINVETGTALHIEADYGLTLTHNKMVMYVNAYNHTDKKITVKSAILNGASAKNKSITVKMNDKTAIDTKNYKTGLYTITVKFSTGKSLSIYFWVNTNNASPARVEYVNGDKAYERRVAMNDAFDAAVKSTVNGGFARDGSKSIALDKFYYPQYHFNQPNKYRVDTQRWADKSDEIITDKTWSDEYKAYKLAIWLAENIAYDSYKVNNLRLSRAGTVGIYDGTYSVWNLKTGVCWDFANIYAIMCRHQGIACATMNSESLNHMWNLVRINGRWMELDISHMTKYVTFKKDATVRTKVGLELDCAFDVIPYTYSTPKDLTVNGYLMYGDPNSKADQVYYVS